LQGASTRLAVLICVVFSVALVLVVLNPHRPATGVVVLDRAQEAVFSVLGGSEELWRAGDVALSQNWSTDTPYAVRSASEPLEARYRRLFQLSGSGRPPALKVGRV
jgi:hypothetical protein